MSKDTNTLTARRRARGLAPMVLIAALALSAAAARAQTAPPDAGTPDAATPGVASQSPETVESAPPVPAETVKIVARPLATMAIPETAPAAVDLRLIAVPGVAPALTEGVTARGWTRYVKAQGKRIGQLVLSRVAKDGRSAPLDPSAFALQFDIDADGDGKDGGKPGAARLSAGAPLTVEGDRAQLTAALEALAAAPEDGDNKDKKDKPARALAAAAPAAGARNAGSNAPRNDEAERYKSPEPLPAAPEERAPEVRVTTEGCHIRVDLDLMQAIQQSRVVTTQDGQSEYGACEDGDERFRIEQSYGACSYAEDLEGRTATAQFVYYYTAGNGERHEVGDCRPDPERVYDIVEDRGACPVSLDYERLQATPQARLVYTDANNRRVTVRECAPSKEVAAAVLTPTTEGCSIRDDFDAGVSYERVKYRYRLEGRDWETGCMDGGKEYRQETVYETASGAPICPAIIDRESGQATLQSRVKIEVGGVAQYRTPCTPDADGQEIVATTAGCEDPSAWTHDLAAGQSYGSERYYFLYMRGKKQEFVTGCQDSATVYPHHAEIVGWQTHDDKHFAYPITRVTIEGTPVGRYVIVSGRVMPGATRVAYVYQGKSAVASGKTWYEGCARFDGRATVETWRRPDDTDYAVKTGTATPVKKNACTSRKETVASGKTWYQDCARFDGRDVVETRRREDGVEFKTKVADATPLRADGVCRTEITWDEAHPTEETYNYDHPYSPPCRLTRTVTATRLVTREDGKVISNDFRRGSATNITPSRTCSQDRWYDYPPAIPEARRRQYEKEWGWR